MKNRPRNEIEEGGGCGEGAWGGGVQRDSRDVRIGVQPQHLRGVCGGEGGHEVNVLRLTPARGQAVPFVEPGGGGGGRG